MCTKKESVMMPERMPKVGEKPTETISVPVTLSKVGLPGCTSTSVVTMPPSTALMPLMVIKMIEYHTNRKPIELMRIRTFRSLNSVTG